MLLASVMALREPCSVDIVLLFVLVLWELLIRDVLEVVFL